MKKFIFIIFLFFILVYAGAPTVAFASELPYDGSFFLDGFPVDGTVIGTAAVDVYEFENHEFNLIDTLQPGTVVTLTSIFVYADGVQYYTVTYTKDEVSCSGYIEFYSIEPIDAEITPAPEVNLDDYNLDRNWFQTFIDFITGFKNFLLGLKNLLFIIFPFFTPAEIAFIITALIGFLGLLVYLLIRKVTI